MIGGTKTSLRIGAERERLKRAKRVRMKVVNEIMMSIEEFNRVVVSW